MWGVPEEAGSGSDEGRDGARCQRRRRWASATAPMASDTVSETDAGDDGEGEERGGWAFAMKEGVSCSVVVVCRCKFD